MHKVSLYVSVSLYPNVLAFVFVVLFFSTHKADTKRNWIIQIRENLLLVFVFELCFPSKDPQDI